ncbi:hypothetical protein [Noviherbaspirillum denitrificans]|uniref:Uncharacterized protein n=1 Tax=Noviherbaspirillum denitrificans TaxID=1968433 RepID=A0A254TB95_9BURK|nr:hypothetical protein [Noviherbaspirillum denitrificans]OWW19904.1 hypothetical protein AYR66_10720 [Noviherbaspirillum denitrificans]
MATLTIANPTAGTIGSSYAENVGRAARALLAALFAVTPRAEQPAQVRQARENVSLYRLYRMSASDSVMPNLAQELDMIARRA